MKRIHLLIGALLLAAALIPFRSQIRALLRGVSTRTNTVTERVRQYGPAVHARLSSYFLRAHVNYPPKHLVFVGVKDEDEVQVYAADDNSRMCHIRNYHVLAASGELGPKLREGDNQVPEGLYGIDALNPNSAYHLALHINYPDAFDRKMAKRYARNNLGGDIMMHGSNVSAGCLAMGDEAAEDLFVMAADTGIKNVEVILSPIDFHSHRMPDKVIARMPGWTEELYTSIKERLAKLPQP